MVKVRDVLSVSGKTNTIVSALVKQTVQWADLFERVSLKAGQELFPAGMRSPFIYAPIDAVVSLVATSGGTGTNGEPYPDVTLSVLGSGDLINVAQLLGNSPSSAGAIVDMGGVALRASAQAARRIMDAHEESRHVVQAYSNLAQAESWQWLAASVQLPVLARVAAYLLIHWQTAGTEVVTVTHRMMAARMAIRRPSVTEALQQLDRDGIIRQADRGRLDVKDAKRLVALVRDAWPLYSTHRQAFRDALD